MHKARTGKTECIAGQAFQTRPQREVRALDLLPRQLPSRVLRGREMPSIDSHRVRAVTSDAQGGEQGAEFQALRLLPGTADVREHARQTNHVERFNCTLRQRVSRLVRATLSFSKKLTNHIGAIKYFIRNHNLTKCAAFSG